ncbi:hypothetical protein C4579_03160 [Candidatus Microgenomates bacterium]|nr:MAG: hypothetical protein C4579_03160 [Candidatus Microgenomates bacterium]
MVVKDFANYHPVVAKIIALLTQHAVWFETHQHTPVITSHEASQVRGEYTLSQGAKAMIVKITKNGEHEFVMLVLPGDKRFDNKKVKNLLNAKEVEFATADDIAQLTNGIQIGGVPPFGNLFGINVFADESLLKNEKIIFNAGDRRFSIAMNTKDWQKIVIPHQAIFVKN